jgi:F-type H+-transporting ATPase subunit epsilon
MNVSLVSPEKELFNGEITLISLPGVDGSFELMNNHAPIISALGEGTIKIIETSGTEHFFEIKSGVIECSKNKVIVLAEEK